MFGLTPMRRSVNRYEVRQNAFGGFDWNEGAAEGSIRRMSNMTSDQYPLLTSRKPRYELEGIRWPAGFFARDSIYWVSDNKLFVDGTEVGTVSYADKRFAAMQDKVLIFPDKVAYDHSEGKLVNLEAVWEDNAELCDGTYAQEEAKANTIRKESSDDWTAVFRVGDAVTVWAASSSGSSDGTEDYTEPAEGMGPYVIREISYENGVGELRFYEKTWSEILGEKQSLALHLKVARLVPDMDYVFEHGNRLWGCKGSKIYASKLGDPANWNVFDGLSTDSFMLEVGSSGGFTGCCAYGGRPVFFKEREILKIYGDAPQSYQTVRTECLGVEEYSGKSLAEVDGVLYFKSKAGIMAYTGSYPRCVSQAFGTSQYHNAVAGTDGIKYYVSMQEVHVDGEMVTELFVYDPRYGTWYKEDVPRIMDWACGKDLMCMDITGKVYVVGNPRGIRYKNTGEEIYEPWPEMVKESGDVTSSVVFGDFYDGTSRKKVLGKIRLRMQVEEGASVDVEIHYDDGTSSVKTFAGDGKKKAMTAVLRLRRCDHYSLRFIGRGQWTLYEITRDRYIGSDK